MTATSLKEVLQVDPVILLPVIFLVIVWYGVIFEFKQSSSSVKTALYISGGIVTIVGLLFLVNTYGLLTSGRFDISYLPVIEPVVVTILLSIILLFSYILCVSYFKKKSTWKRKK